MRAGAIGSSRIVRVGHRSAWSSAALTVLLAWVWAPVAAGAGLSWSAAELVDRAPPFSYGFDVADVSCAPASACVAVDQKGDVLSTAQPFAGSDAWTLTHVIAGQFDAVACPSADECFAVDDGGEVLWSTTAFGGGSWQSVRVDGSGALVDISCPTTAFCVAVDAAGHAFVSTDPTGPAASWSVVALPGADRISCPTTSFCAAMGAGWIYTSTSPDGGAGSWSSGFQLYQPRYGVSALSCASASLCVAVDDDGNVVSSSDPTGGPSAWTIAPIAPGPTYLLDVSCPTDTFCAIASRKGVLVSDDPAGGASTWASSTVDAPDSSTYYNQLTGISCPSSSACVATDQLGNVITSQDADSRPSTWSRAQVDGYNAISSIACEPDLMCAAGDTEGNALATANPALGPSSWRAAHLATGPNLTGDITALSCTITNVCVASAATGSYVSVDPPAGQLAWTSANQAPTPPAIYCLTATFCIGPGYDATFLTATSPLGPWTPSRVPISSGGFLGIIRDTLSCPSASLCVALGVPLVPQSNPQPGAPLFTPAGTAKLMTSTDPAGGAQTWTYVNFRLPEPSALTCPSLTLCLAIANGRVLSSADPTGPASSWTATQLGAGYLSGMSCPSQWFCAITSLNTVLTSTNPSGLASAWTATTINISAPYEASGPLGPLADGLDGISCGSTFLCVAYDASGQVLVGTGTPGSYGDGSAHVGRAALTSRTAAIPLSCTGQPTAACKIEVTITAAIKHRHSPTTRQGHGNVITNTIIAQRTMILRAGSRLTTTIAFTRNGRSQLRRGKPIAINVIGIAEKNTVNSIVARQRISRTPG
jgi:hypothetical protein